MRNLSIVGYALLVVSLITAGVWLVSRFVQPALPNYLRSEGLLIIAILLAVLGALAAFKDTIELLKPIFVSRPKRDLVHNLPQPDYKKFIGRSNELQQIMKQLAPEPEGRYPVIAIDGVGGVGKTALALEVADTYRREYSKMPKKKRFDAIVWSTAKKTVLSGDGIMRNHQALDTLSDIYIAIAATLRRRDILNAHVSQQDNLVRHALTAQRTLLILDNLETVTDDRVFSFIRDVPSPTKVIVTTRRRMDVSYPIRLVGMNGADALELVDDECTKKNVQLTSLQKSELAECTSGVPLAIVWTIALLGMNRQLTVSTVLQRLRSNTDDYAQFCFQDIMSHLRGSPAYRLLMAFTLLGGDSTFDEIRSVANIPEDSALDGIHTLVILSLLNESGDKYSALPLTLGFLQGELEANGGWFSLIKPALDPYLDRIRALNARHQGTGFRRRGSTKTIPMKISLLDGGHADTVVHLDMAPVTLNEATDQHPRLFLVGNPGSGKTTLLKQFAISVADGSQDQVPFLDQIPVYFSSRDLEKNDFSLRQQIVESFECCELPNTERFVERLLDNGKILMLLDGIDELEDKKRISSEVASWVNRYPKNRVLIASRPLPFLDVLGFAYAEMLPFSEQQVYEYAISFFSDAQRAEKFVQTLRSDVSLSELSNNPLTLSLLCTVFENRGRLPDRRSDLYESALDAMLKSWDSARYIVRGDNRQLGLEARKSLLAHVAYESLLSDQDVISESNLERYLEQAYLKTYGGVQKSVEFSDDLIKIATGDPYLIIEEFPGAFSFVSASWQEYLASWKLVHAAGIEDYDHALRRIRSPRWRTVITLFVEGASSTQLSQLMELVESSVDELLRRHPVFWLTRIRSILESIPSGDGQVAELAQVSEAIRLQGEESGDQALNELAELLSVYHIVLDAPTFYGDGNQVNVVRGILLRIDTIVDEDRQRRRVEPSEDSVQRSTNTDTTMTIEGDNDTPTVEYDPDDPSFMSRDELWYRGYISDSQYFRRGK